MDTETALAAAYDVANQAYTSSEQAYTNDQATSAQVQAEGDTAQAIAIADVVFAAPSQPITSTATGTGPVNIDAQSPLTAKREYYGSRRHQSDGGRRMAGEHSGR